MAYGNTEHCGGIALPIAVSNEFGCGGGIVLVIEILFGALFPSLIGILQGELLTSFWNAAGLWLLTFFVSGKGLPGRPAGSVRRILTTPVRTAARAVRYAKAVGLFKEGSV